jgi:hypothetical protein
MRAYCFSRPSPPHCPALSGPALLTTRAITCLRVDAPFSAFPLRQVVLTQPGGQGVRLLQPLCPARRRGACATPPRGRHAAARGLARARRATPGGGQLLGSQPLSSRSCAEVSLAFREAVDKALPLLPRIAFPKGGDVLSVLKRVAGTNLKLVGLEGCRQLSPDDMARILKCLATTCPAVMEIDMAGCTDDAIARALAVGAQKTFGAVSPADLRALLMAQVEGEGVSRRGHLLTKSLLSATPRGPRRCP